MDFKTTRATSQEASFRDPDPDHFTLTRGTHATARARGRKVAFKFVLALFWTTAVIASVLDSGECSCLILLRGRTRPGVNSIAGPRLLGVGTWTFLG